LANRIRLLTLAPVLAAGAALLLGCGTKTYSGAQLAQSVKPKLQQQTGVKNFRLTCPSGVAAKAGARTHCKAVAKDGSALDVLVTMKDDKGHFTYKATHAKK
jgi:hypothetical protein